MDPWIRLQIMASPNSYWLQSYERAAAAWAINRIKELENLTRAQAERIHAQSELLSRNAEVLDPIAEGAAV